MGTRTFAPHVKLTANGIFGDGSTGIAEIWSIGVSAGHPDGTAVDPSALAAMANAAQTFFTGIITNGGNTFPHFRNSLRIRTVKASPIGANGKLSGDPATNDLDIGGSEAATPEMPLQCALVVTLDTTTTRRHPGRFYLPVPIFNGLDAQARVQGVAAELATQIAVGITTLNTALAAASPGVQVIVASAHDSVTGDGVGVNRPVLSVRVGDVIDTMRSRRNKQVEHYSSHNV